MYVIVLVTASNEKESEEIARKLLRNRLAACVNILPNIRSLFWWDDQIEHSEETLMIIKSKMDMFDQLVETVKSIHSYQVPEILALPVQKGFTGYLNWLDSVASYDGSSRE